jgi:hypothetical protein
MDIINRPNFCLDDVSESVLYPVISTNPAFLDPVNRAVPYLSISEATRNKIFQHSKIGTTCGSSDKNTHSTHVCDLTSTSTFREKSAIQAETTESTSEKENYICYNIH